MTTKEKDFVIDGLSNDDITITISKIIQRAKDNDIRKLNEMERYEKLKNEFEFFSSRYPILFELATRDEIFPWDNLSYMLNMRKKVINDELTSDGASKIVGSEWFNKYVNIDKIPKDKNNNKTKN